MTASVAVELRDLVLHYGMRAMPTPVCSALGAVLSTGLGQRAFPAADARARLLIERLRPDLASSPEVLNANLRLLWQNIGRTYAEFASIERAVPEGRVTMLNADALEAAYDGDRPLILCFVHLGNWEILGQQVARHSLVQGGRPFAAVVMPPENRAHAFIAARRRAALPVTFVPMGNRVWHAVTETLRRPRGIVWLAADEVANKRVFAPHFGRRPRIDGNLGKIVRLAAATGARVLPMYNERLAATRFQSHVLPIQEMPRGRLDDAAITEQVMRIDGIFAPVVRRLLTQWYMATAFNDDPDDPVVGSETGMPG